MVMIASVVMVSVLPVVALAAGGSARCATCAAHVIIMPHMRGESATCYVTTCALKLKECWVAGRYLNTSESLWTTGTSDCRYGVLSTDDSPGSDCGVKPAFKCNLCTVALSYDDTKDHTYVPCCL